MRRLMSPGIVMSPTQTPMASPTANSPRRPSSVAPALELPILRYLKTKRVILASASPRRRALLGQIGLTNLDIRPSTFAEDLDKSSRTPEEYVAETARQKCFAVYEAALGEPAGDPHLVISADTIVVTRAGRILEKPRNANDHLLMLQQLRDTRRHRVLTAVCVMAPRADARRPGYALETHVEETTVVFADAENGGLDDSVLQAYIQTREGVDKAGGYAVQGIGGLMLVERIEGSVDNVIGLPVRKCLAMAEQVVFLQGHDDEDIEE